MTEREKFIEQSKKRIQDVHKRQIISTNSLAGSEGFLNELSAFEVCVATSLSLQVAIENALEKNPGLTSLTPYKKQVDGFIASVFYALDEARDKPI